MYRSSWNSTVLENCQTTNVFNEYFVTMAEDIGENETISPHDTVDSISHMYNDNTSVKHIKRSVHTADS